VRPRDAAFVLAQTDGLRAPLVLVTLTTPAGIRVFTSGGLSDAELAVSVGSNKLDGTWALDGTHTFGSEITPLIGSEIRVLQFGQMRDTGSILPTINIRGRRGREAGNAEVVLRNDDDYFGKLLAVDTILSAGIEVTVGYRGIPRDKFISRFKGVVQEHVLTREQFTLRAESA
jgi:hypothetical protein